jgi:flagellar biosynthesis GTPase FlhF
MTNNLIEWNSKFTTSEKSVSDGLTRLVLKGILIDTTENKNNWCVEEDDFKQLAQDFIGKQVRCDHGEHVGNVLGRVISTEVDSGHAEAKSEWDIANVNPHIHYVAEIASKDNDLIVPIAMGFVDYVSPAVDARMLLCSNCRTPMMSKTQKGCNCSEGSLLLKNLEARELSLVASPAYSSTVAKVYSFAAAVDNSIQKINGDINMAEDIRIVKLEASVSALIAAFRAAQEEQEEEKKEELKAEEEAKLVAEEEEAKMVPVSEVAEEEEKSEDKEDKEEQEEKIEKLEASIRQLASLMKASMITPETPEDEPADSVHKVPKITNENVKSEKLKDGFKFPIETGGMKPGKIKASAGRTKGTSTSFTGSVAKDENVEQTAVDEIFGFAASRGTLPMIPDSRIKTIRYNNGSK